MANKVQVEYEEMVTIAAGLKVEYDELQKVFQGGKQAFQGLRGHWASPAATDFYSATQDLLNRFDKLVGAVDELVETSYTITETLREIEEDAKSQFDWMKNLSPAAPDASRNTNNPTQQKTSPLPDAFWIDYVNKTSADQMNRAAGCVAYVLETTYVPWVSDVPGIRPGNAGEWATKAQEWATAHPEYGITIDDTPTPGAIATWTTGGNGYGHVAKVVSVDGDQFTTKSGNTWRSTGGGNALGVWYGQGDAVNSNPFVDTYTGTGNGAKFIHFPWEEM